MVGGTIPMVGGTTLPEATADCAFSALAAPAVPIEPIEPIEPITPIAGTGS